MRLDVETAIAAAEEAYIAALNSEDLEGVLSYFTDDARVLAPGSETITGKDGD